MDKFKLFQKRLEGAYRTTFNGNNPEMHSAAVEVIADLKKYCGATKSIFSKDALEMAKAEGRREVFLHIMDYMKLDYINDVYELDNDYDDLT